MKETLTKREHARNAENINLDGIIKGNITMKLLLLSLITLLSGCMVIWTDDVFIATAFKVVDANDLEMIAEPNYLQIGSGVSKTKNDKIKAITPYGVVETK